MVKKEQFVAAIDIGTTKIVAIIGKRNENKKLEILGISKTLSKGVKRGVVLNIEEAVNAISTIVDEVQKKTSLKCSDVFVGIAGQHIKSIRNRGYINCDSDDHEIKQEDIDIVLVPGRVFDANCNRVGRGGGFYDRFLHKLKPSSIKIAIAYSCQVVDDVPQEEWDHRVNCILTENGIINQP